MPSPPSTIHLYSPALASKPATRHYIVYFIPGNPGLIGYYHIFLTHLYSLLTTSSTSIPGKTSLGSGLDSEPEAQSHIPTQSPGNVSYEIFGRSLSGFETDGKGQWDKSAPYNVEQQIEQSEQALRNVVYAAKANGKRDVRVILMGHSLGTYICLELMRRLREEATRAVQTNGVADGNDEGEGKGKGKGKETVQVVGGALLFATVIELAKSPSGVKFKRLLAIPYFPITIHLLAKFLTLFLPTFVLTSLIRLFMGFPKDAAHVTASFVKSPHGVYQALHLAHDEMTALSTDKWGSEIWGSSSPPPPSPSHPSSHPSKPPPTLRFLFSSSDHWIANSTRDSLIAARGTIRGPRLQHDAAHEDWKPVMEVDEEDGWVHGFCVTREQSVGVAGRARGYVGEIVRRDLGV